MYADIRFRMKAVVWKNKTYFYASGMISSKFGKDHKRNIEMIIIWVDNIR